MTFDVTLRFMDLPEFLLARIAEDEANAENYHDYTEDDLRLLEFYGTSTCTCSLPARMRDDAAAKRLIMEEHASFVMNDYHVGDDPTPVWLPVWTGHCSTCSELRAPVTIPCTTLVALAQAYKSHSDFDASWLVP